MVSLFLIVRRWRNEGTKRSLREWKKQSNKGRKTDKKKRKEKFSTREIEELMGVHGPRYERRRGALRQK